MSRLPGEIVGPGTVSVLGSRLAVPNGAGAELPAGTAVDVLVRPESIRLRPSADGPAVVVRTSFFGASVRVVAVLPGDVEVASTLSAGESQALPAGARAHIELLEDVLFVLARQPAP